MFEIQSKIPLPRCILGLDVGDKRVGVSIGFTESGLATPLDTYERAGGSAERSIISIVKEKGVELLLIGMPIGEQGELSEQCHKIERFCRRLQKRIEVEIGYIDEYATSMQAKELLSSTSSAHLRKKLGKGAVDAISAMLIVESYLNSRQYIKVGLLNSD